MTKPIRLLMLLLIVLALSIPAAFAQEDTAPPFIGITFAPDGISGVVITTIADDSPAASAALEVEDVLVTLDDKLVTANNLSDLVNEYSVGDAVVLGILRDGQTLELTLTFAERSEGMVAGDIPGFSINPDDLEVMPPKARLGVAVDSVSEENGAGAVILNVVPESPAAEGGIQVGDIIVSVDENTITNPTALIDIISEYEPGNTVTIELLRDDEPITVDVTLDAAPPRITLRGNHGSDDMLRIPQMLDYEDGKWIVEEATEGDPFYEVGLREGDVINAVNGETVDNPQKLFDVLSEAMTESTAVLTVERDGETLVLDVPPTIIVAMMIALNAG